MSERRSESEAIYPKEPRERDPRLNRPWRLDCELVYGGDGGGWGAAWSKGYRTRIGARVAAWWHYHIASWGGSVALVDQRTPPAQPDGEASA